MLGERRSNSLFAPAAPAEPERKPEQAEVHDISFEERTGRSLFAEATTAPRASELFFAPQEKGVTFAEALSQVQGYLSETYATLITEDNSDAKEQMKRRMARYLQENRIAVDGMTASELVDALYTEMAEYGFLTKYIFADGIEEIDINSWRDIEIQYSDGHTAKLEEHFDSPEHAANVIRRMLQNSGKVLDNASPIITSRLAKNIRISVIKTPVLDEEDRVCGFNPAATALYRRMGYIGTLAGMPVNNIQPAALSECDQDRHETALANRVLQYQRLPLSSGQARAALIIHDLTRQRQLEEELALQRTALQELRHRMKNTLQMLANLTRSRGCDPAESPPVQTALLDTANRLLSLAATLDGIVQVSREKVSLLQILEQIRRYMLQTLLPSARRVTIHVGGEDVIVSADCASSVALVVNELVQNALKYAFPSGQAGRIGIELHSGRPLCQLTVWDNGVGFQADRPRPGGAGLELASTIVREKLTGEWSLESGPGGTRISFDFLEQ